MLPAPIAASALALAVYGCLVSGAEYPAVGPEVRAGNVEPAAIGAGTDGHSTREYPGGVAHQPGASARKSCVDCHSKSNPSMVAAWQESAHAAHKVGCAQCHGDNHSRIFEVKGAVSAAVCGSCHARQLNQFERSLHAEAVDLLKPDPRFDRLSPSMADATCNSCHQIGAHFPDGSRGQCNSCHSGHLFSLAEARRPEACAACHTGPDHPQLEMWQTSKHGQLFAAEETRSQAPTCVTCHMPGGRHDTGVGLGLGNVANGAVLESADQPVTMRSLSAAEAELQRGLMIETCLPCHSSRFATESLGTADAVKHEADAVLGEAAAIIAQLRTETSLGGESPALTVAANDTPVLDGPLRRPVAEPDFEAASPIEQRFVDMVKFHHATTFKGAYHHSPMHTHNLGFVRLKQDLNFIKWEAARIRDRDSDPQP